MRTAFSVFLALFIVSISSQCHARDYWVYLRMDDKAGATIEKTAGMGKAGDIITVIPATKTPSKREKEIYAIYKVLSVSDAQRQEWLAPMMEDTGKKTLMGEPIRELKAFRKTKIDLTKIKDIKRGINLTVDQSFITDKKEEKTSVDLVRYERLTNFARYVKYPLRRITDFLTPTASALSTVTSTTNKTGEDYASLQAWEDDKDGDITAAGNDTIQVLEVYDDDGAIDETVSFGGWTTNTTNYIKIHAPSGEKHNGTAASGAKIAYTTAGSVFIFANSGIDVYIEDLIFYFKTPQAYNNSAVIFNQTASDTFEINRCIFYANASQGVNSNGNAFVKLESNTPWHVTNSEFYGLKPGTGSETGFGVVAACSGNACYFINNTTQNNSTGICVYGGDRVLSNMLGQDNDAADFACGFHSASTNNLSSDTTAPPYNTYYTEINVDFVNESVGSENLHLASTSTDAIDHGVDFGTYWSEHIDIDGRDRDSEEDTWDIGADEYVAAAGGDTYYPFKQLFHGINVGVM